MSSPTLVKDVMQPACYVLAGTPLNEVVEVLLQHKLLGLPVVNAQHQVIGFVSEQDCIHAILVSSYHCEGWPNVDEVMHDEPFTVAPDLLIVDLAQNMGKEKPKVYPVVEHGLLAGIVTRGDVLRGLSANRAVCDNTGTHRDHLARTAR